MQARPVPARRMNGSRSRTKRNKERTTTPQYSRMIHKTKIKPYSSAATAIMKSVCASGRDHLTCPSPTPTPNNPPSRMAFVAYPICVVGSISAALRKPSIRRAKCSELEYAITPPITTKAAIATNKIIGAPATKYITPQPNRTKQA